VTKARIIELRLTDPDLDFWVDTRLCQFGGTWLAAADLAGTPDIGVSTDRDLAVLFALWSLGPDVAQRMASRVPGVSTDPGELRTGRPSTRS
jgi:hypothetical protein